MSTESVWIQRVLETVSANLEWQSLGAIAYRVTEDRELLLAPAGAEVVGGRHDGEQVYSGYQLAVSAVAELFDRLPEIHLNTHPLTSLSFIGTIGGETAVVMVFTHPFPDNEHEFRVYGNGSWGPKSLP
ncbi:MAG: hypothetical protein KatS3mg114_0865 [Planctomycetaceae bacterium]|jgi:hypothetical protein|nr:MAG: hypothetical protein KatS3mg114_0865 [Planctomycetaceae bacterium]